MLQNHINDPELELKFYREFNKLILTLFPDLHITDYNTLLDWNQYKNKHKNELIKINLNDNIFRTIQNFCINFFITAFKENKNFKDIFIKNCLGIIPENSSDWNYFVENGFYIIKGIENGFEAKDITPLIPPNPNIKIYIKQNSVQSFIIEFDNTKYEVTIRTSMRKKYV